MVGTLALCPPDDPANQRDASVTIPTIPANPT
jgi:hypothetical protein